MQLFEGCTFFTWAAALSIPAIILGLREKNIKYDGFAATVFFVVMAMKSKPEAIAYMAGYCLFQLLLAKLFIYLTGRYGRRSWLYWMFILMSLSPLAVNKLTGQFGTSILGFIGISYMTFKALQVIIEAYDGLIESVDPFEYVYFLTFFPCVLSGPIDRSRRFMGDIDTVIPKAEYINMLGTGIYKILLGAVYKFALANGFYQAMLWLGKGGTLQANLIYMYTYGFYLFFDFAGYTLMAVGLSYVFGVKSPENFNKPFLSTDMKDFWDRWHISLSHWFRDFIFSRFMMRSIKGKWFKNKLTSASIGFIINMTVMGVWHGLDIYYIMYGVYHGVLLALTEIYQKKSKFHKKHKKEKWYKGVSWFITFNLVMFGFFIFSGRFTQLIGLSN